MVEVVAHGLQSAVERTGGSRNGYMADVLVEKWFEIKQLVLAVGGASPIEVVSVCSKGDDPGFSKELATS